MTIFCVTIVEADTVSNMDLGAVVRAHKARRAKDKNAIMTMVRTESTSTGSKRGSLNFRGGFYKSLRDCRWRMGPLPNLSQRAF